MFWVANSISATALGWNNRRLQEKAHERNEEFQREMQRAREISDDKRIQEEIAFKRRMVALSRQYRREESAEAFNAQLKLVELQHYLRHCWPLDPQLPYVFLNRISSSTIEPGVLNVILLHSPLLPQKKYGGANDDDLAIYRNIEYRISNEDIPAIKNVKFWKDAAYKDDRGTVDIKAGNARLMNIHFLLSQLPTLVISPSYSEGKMRFTGAVWEPQASRPLIKPLFEYDYDPVLASSDKKYLDSMIDIFHCAVSITIGVVRDSYMLMTCGERQTLGTWLNDNKHDHMRQILEREPMIKQFIENDKMALLESMDPEQNPKLLEVFTPEELINIHKLAISNF